MFKWLFGKKVEKVEQDTRPESVVDFINNHNCYVDYNKHNFTIYMIKDFEHMPILRGEVNILKDVKDEFMFEMLLYSYIDTIMPVTYRNIYTNCRSLGPISTGCGREKDLQGHWDFERGFNFQGTPLRIGFFNNSKYNL